MADEQKRLGVLIDAELHKELKIAAAKAGVTLAAFVTDALKDKLKKEEE